MNKPSSIPEDAQLPSEAAAVSAAAVPSDISVSTMLLDDVFFLEIWLKHWLSVLPPEHLYVIDDGPSDEIATLCTDKGVNHVIAPERPVDGTNETGRWEYISEFLAGQLSHYDIAVHTDVDEILVADPQSGGLLETIRANQAPVGHPVGIEVMDRSDTGTAPVDLSRPILSQRPHYRMADHFCKGCVLRTPVRFSNGGHGHTSAEMDFVDGLYLIHLKYFDSDFFVNRSIETLSRPNQVGRKHAPVRRDKAGIMSTLESLKKRRCVPFPMLPTGGIKRRIKTNHKNRLNPEGFYRMQPNVSRFDYVLPQRFRTLL